MTEKELIELGFRRINVKAENSISPVDWYYYEYIFGGDYCTFDLASGAANHTFPRTGKENDWYVHLPEIDDSIHITEISDVKLLIDLIDKIKDILHLYE